MKKKAPQPKRQKAPKKASYPLSEKPEPKVMEQQRSSAPRTGRGVLKTGSQAGTEF